MNIKPTKLNDVFLIEPQVFEDSRGFFMESFNCEQFSQAVGRSVTFVQDNHSKSGKGVLRGLHYQIKQPQGKLVRVVKGRVLDVAVDLRRSSSTYKQWAMFELTAENKRQLWVPEGFAHGFLTLTDDVEFLYKTTDYYAPEYERSILWSDPELDIEWPDLEMEFIVSNKDMQGVLLKNADIFK